MTGRPRVVIIKRSLFMDEDTLLNVARDSFFSTRNIFDDLDQRRHQRKSKA